MADMNYIGTTASVTALANVIACNLTIDEITLLATIFVQLGDTLATIATSRELCENRSN